MAKFTYVVQDNEGIHARPAGMLAKEAKALEGVKVTTKKLQQLRWKSSSKQTCKRKSYIYSFNF